MLWKKSQDSAIRKIRDMSETYSEEKAKFESTILLLETKEKELSSHVEKIEFVSSCWSFQPAERYF